MGLFLIKTLWNLGFAAQTSQAANPDEQYCQPSAGTLALQLLTIRRSSSSVKSLGKYMSVIHSQFINIFVGFRKTRSASMEERLSCIRFEEAETAEYPAHCLPEGGYENSPRWSAAEPWVSDRLRDFRP